MARRPTGTSRTSDDTPPESGGGFGGVLRGSVNSMVGAAGGLGLPLRAVERLTSAVEHAAAILERLERASSRLDELDDDLPARVTEALDNLAAMSEDTRSISERMETLEDEVRELRTLIGERFERVPLLRTPRRERKAKADPPAAAGRSRRARGAVHPGLA